MMLVDPYRYAPPVVTLSDDAFSDSTGLSGEASHSSAAITSSVTGGRAGYTYLWTKESGTTFTLTSGSTASSQVFTSACPTSGGRTDTAVYRCTATDANGQSGYALVTVEHVWANLEFATWNSATKTGNVTLSNGDKTAAFATYNGTEIVASTFGLKGAEAVIRCFEIYYDAVSNPNGTTSQQVGINAEVASITSATTGIRHEHYNGYSKLRIGSGATTSGASDTTVAAPVATDVWGYVFDMTASPATMQVYLNGVATGPSRQLNNAYIANGNAFIWACGHRGTVTGSNTTTITLRSRSQDMTYWANYGASRGFSR